MSDDDSEAPAAPEAVTDWSSKRLEVTYQEARNVLDAQQTRLQNTDDKALRTTRLTMIALGVLVSLIEAFDLTISGPLAILGALFLFGSFAAGLATYNISDPNLGLSPASLEQLMTGEFDPPDETWEEYLLRTAEYWIETNEADIHTTDLLLVVTDTLLFVGIAVLALAIVL
jgi:hypothetical protein